MTEEENYVTKMDKKVLQRGTSRKKTCGSKLGKLALNLVDFQIKVLLEKKLTALGLRFLDVVVSGVRKGLLGAGPPQKQKNVYFSDYLPKFILLLRKLKNVIVGCHDCHYNMHLPKFVSVDDRFPK